MADIPEIIRQHLDASADKKERIEKIDDLLHMLNFEHRLASMTDEEREYMVAAGEVRMTPENRKYLDGLKTDAERDKAIEGWARACYFAQCAWSDYLNGTSPNKPFTSKPVRKLKIYQPYAHCQECDHQGDVHGMSCMECCPVKRGDVAAVSASH